jgi:hypothetical protein
MAQQGTAGHSRGIPGLSAFLAMHSPVVTPHFKISVGTLNDHQPDPRPEEEASPKDRRIPAHNKGSGVLALELTQAYTCRFVGRA